MSVAEGAYPVANRAHKTMRGTGRVTMILKLEVA